MIEPDKSVLRPTRVQENSVASDLKGKQMFNKILLVAVPALMVGIFTISGQALACACCNTYKVVHVASWDVLNIRTGPGAAYKKIGAIPADDACIIKTGHKHGKWHEISYAGITGWVHSHYLKFMTSPK